MKKIMSTKERVLQPVLSRIPTQWVSGFTYVHRSESFTPVIKKLKKGSEERVYLDKLLKLSESLTKKFKHAHKKEISFDDDIKGILYSVLIQYALTNNLSTYLPSENLCDPDSGCQALALFVKDVIEFMAIVKPLHLKRVEILNWLGKADLADNALPIIGLENWRKSAKNVSLSCNFEVLMPYLMTSDTRSYDNFEEGIKKAFPNDLRCKQYLESIKSAKLKQETYSSLKLFKDTVYTHYIQTTLSVASEVSFGLDLEVDGHNVNFSPKKIRSRDIVKSLRPESSILLKAYLSALPSAFSNIYEQLRQTLNKRLDLDLLEFDSSTLTHWEYGTERELKVLTYYLSNPLMLMDLKTQFDLTEIVSTILSTDSSRLQQFQLIFLKFLKKILKSIRDEELAPSLAILDCVSNQLVECGVFAKKGSLGFEKEGRVVVTADAAKVTETFGIADVGTEVVVKSSFSTLQLTLADILGGVEDDCLREQIITALKPFLIRSFGFNLSSPSHEEVYKEKCRQLTTMLASFSKVNQSNLDRIMVFLSDLTFFQEIDQSEESEGLLLHSIQTCLQSLKSSFNNPFFDSKKDYCLLRLKTLETILKKNAVINDLRKLECLGADFNLQFELEPCFEDISCHVTQDPLATVNLHKFKHEQAELNHYLAFLNESFPLKDLFENYIQSLAVNISISDVDDIVYEQLSIIMPKSSTFDLDTTKSVLQFFQDERNIDKLSEQCNLCGHLYVWLQPFNKRSENLNGDELTLYNLLQDKYDSLVK